MQIIVLLLITLGCFTQKHIDVGVIDIIDDKVCVVQIFSTEEIIEVTPKLCQELSEGDVFTVIQK